VTVLAKRGNPGCLIQILWFALVGWWAGQAWITAAYICMVSIIGIPLGIAMLNHLPKVMALRDPSEVAVTLSYDGGGTRVARVGSAPQHWFLVRALYFVLIGWWVTGLWMEAAYALAMTYVGLPIAFWMFDRVPGLLTLKR